MLLCLGGWVRMLKEVRSVVISGPLILAVGVVILIGGAVTGRRSAIVIGACHCGIVALFVGLVNLLHWSPHNAEAPFMVMGTIHCAAMLFPTVAYTLRWRKRD